MFYGFLLKTYFIKKNPNKCIIPGDELKDQE